MTYHNGTFHLSPIRKATTCTNCKKLPAVYDITMTAYTYDSEFAIEAQLCGECWQEQWENVDD